MNVVDNRTPVETLKKSDWRRRGNMLKVTTGISSSYYIVAQTSMSEFNAINVETGNRISDPYTTVDDVISAVVGYYGNCEEIQREEATLVLGGMRS